MLTRAELKRPNGGVLGYTNVDGKCMVIQYGGAFFLYTEAKERVTDVGRMALRVFVMNDQDIQIVMRLDPEVVRATTQR